MLIVSFFVVVAAYVASDLLQHLNLLRKQHADLS